VKIGLYSFFNNYSTTCSNQGGGEVCQSRIFSVEGSSIVYLYDLHTVSKSICSPCNPSSLPSFFYALSFSPDTNPTENRSVHMNKLL